MISTRQFLVRYVSKHPVHVLLSLLAATVLYLAAEPAHAHAQNENYVWLNVEVDRLAGRFEITYRDIQERLGIDLSTDPDALAGSLVDTAPQVQDYIKEHFALLVDGNDVEYTFGEAKPAEGAGGRFAAYEFETERFSVPPRITIRNEILLSWDAPLHRSLIAVEYDRIREVEYPRDFAVKAFGPNNTVQILDLANLEPILTSREFVWQGFLHVIAGPDHLLFLFALLLTAVLVLRPETGWQPVSSFPRAAWNAVVIVTLFAVAHSLTLALTVLGIVQPAVRLIETLIAFSIVAVAANNIFPILDHGRWLLIVFFGLFHGMGFASAMSDLQFRLVEPVKILFNFNVGIELGQLLIVLVLLPVLFAIRTSKPFKNWLFPAGNFAIIAVAGYWTITRAIGS